MRDPTVLPVLTWPDAETTPNVYFIGSNLLAAEYVMRLLGEEAHICSITHGIVKPVIGVIGPVFILDNCGLLPPLGEFLRQLQPCYPDGKYIVVDSQGTDIDINQMLTLGVHGVIRHVQVMGKLREAVLAVSKGRIWVEEQTLERYVKTAAARGRSNSHHLDVPTLRESQVLELAKERFTNKEMGRMLGVQESTIKFHLSNIYSKLQIVNRLQLTATNARSRCWSFHVAS
jgi:DNA-binding NarL/FixJ family response regulator